MPMSRNAKYIRKNYKKKKKDQSKTPEAFIQGKTERHQAGSVMEPTPNSN
jgi:hypothetical protein